MSELRRGYVFGLAAYGMWGFFPIYWKLLRPATPVEILAHRIVWATVFLAGLLTLVRKWTFLGVLARRPRALAGICLAAALIAVNWGTYIYGVNSDQVVETSLGYFITPLVSVLLGVVVLGEKLRGWQWAALCLGAVAVVVLTVDYGRLPWIALALAASFGCYGLVKKNLGLPAAEGLLVESAVLTIPAAGYLLWLAGTGSATFGQESAAHTVLVVGSGVITAIPLLCFAASANRVPLTALGMMQYLAPILQLCCGVLIYREPMPPARLIGFVLVWCALAVFTWDAIRQVRRRQPVTAERLATQGTS